MPDFNTILMLVAAVAVTGVGVWYFMRRQEVAGPSGLVQVAEDAIDSMIVSVESRLLDTSRHDKVIAAATKAKAADIDRAKTLLAKVQAHIAANGG